MKSAKKMIMVPESEYHALLGSLPGGVDPLVKEKAQIEAKMHKVLKTSKLPADLKMKKHNVLAKQRKQLKNLIENKPQKVVIENLSQLHPPSVAPYLGVSNIQKTTPNVFEYTKELKIPGAPPSKKRKRMEPLIQEKSSTPPPETTTQKYPDIYTHKGPFIGKEYASELIKYIENNKDKFRITEKGEILSSERPTSGTGTNLETVVQFMTKPISRSTVAPRGFSTLFSKLKNDPFYQSLYSKSFQSGSGKLLPRKTLGLKRIKKVEFKPKIWAKL